ncbi:hypothetical protein [Microbispora sp. CSR-4]|uniref:hypothetical protein n=1 Tax=Microbispora sp. CSR-4 TaxID=2592813 RepID=UPI0011CB01E7|nr:hypothetical protein [Microbispora sp. CSR-4]
MDGDTPSDGNVAGGAAAPTKPPNRHNCRTDTPGALIRRGEEEAMEGLEPANAYSTVPLDTVPLDACRSTRARLRRR